MKVAVTRGKVTGEFNGACQTEGSVSLARASLACFWPKNWICFEQQCQNDEKEQRLLPGHSDGIVGVKEPREIRHVPETARRKWSANNWHVFRFSSGSRVGKAPMDRRYADDRQDDHP